MRVVPQYTEGAELLVSGQILQSDGEILNLQIRARDSSNRLWLEKEYTALGESGEYEGISEGKYDTFQDLYNAIANDLAVLKQALPREDLVRIRRTAELRFGRDLVPEAFAGYLVRDGGDYRLRRLPARDDPMLERVRSIRERDYLFIDTLNDHYDGFYRDTWQPYSDWRQFRSEEAENLRRIERDAMTRKLVGIGAVVGAIALSMAGGREVRANTDSLRQLMLIGGTAIRARQSELGIARRRGQRHCQGWVPVCIRAGRWWFPLAPVDVGGGIRSENRLASHRGRLSLWPARFDVWLD